MLKKYYIEFGYIRKNKVGSKGIAWKKHKGTFWDYEIICILIKMMVIWIYTFDSYQSIHLTYVFI